MSVERMKQPERLALFKFLLKLADENGHIEMNGNQIMAALPETDSPRPWDAVKKIIKDGGMSYNLGGWAHDNKLGSMRGEIDSLLNRVTALEEMITRPSK